MIKKGLSDGVKSRKLRTRRKDDFKRTPPSKIVEMNRGVSKRFSNETQAAITSFGRFGVLGSDGFGPLGQVLGQRFELFGVGRQVATQFARTLGLAVEGKLDVRRRPRLTRRAAPAAGRRTAGRRGRHRFARLRQQEAGQHLRFGQTENPIGKLGQAPSHK